MKKTLLLLMAVALCTSLMAQQKAVSTEKTYSVALKKGTTTCIGAEQGVDAVPSYRPSMVQSRASEPIGIIGETHYNSPTNNCSRNTISFNPNTGDAAVVWTMATTSPTRGTGVNYLRDYYWDAIPNANDRIESMRTGWGGHAFTAQGEVVAAHNALTSLEGGLVISTRDKYGEGDWVQYTLHGPEYTIKYPNYNSPEVPTTGLMWPSIAANGDIVHLICVTEQWNSTGLGPNENFPEGYSTGYMGFPTVPLYYRSNDGGKTWNIKAKDFRSDGMSDLEVQRTSADAYAIAVKGDHVVFVYHEHYHFIYYMESFDGGDTWTKKEVYDFDFDWSANTWQAPRLVPSTAAISIDDNDIVHIAFGTRLHSRGADQEENWYTRYTNYPSGIVYWNSELPVISWEDLKALTQTPNGTELDLNTEDQWPFKNYSGYIEVPSVLGFNKYYYWEGGPVYSTTQFRDLGFTLYPRILAKNNRVYLSYQAPLEFPLVYDAGVMNLLRGVFLTVSEDNGFTWDEFNNTSWISYHPYVFSCNWDDYSGPKYNGQGEPSWDGDIIIDIRYENAYPTMSMNTNNNLLILQWYSQYEPFLTTGQFVDEPVNVYTVIAPLDIFPNHGNIQKIWKGEWEDYPKNYGIAINPKPTINTQIYPNPTTDGIVNVRVDTDSPYTLTVTNIMGQVVQTMQAKQNTVQLNVANYAPGIYIVNVKTKIATTSHKLIVK